MHESVTQFQDSTLRIGFILPTLPANLQNHSPNQMPRLILAGSFQPSKHESALEVFFSVVFRKKKKEQISLHMNQKCFADAKIETLAQKCCCLDMLNKGSTLHCSSMILGQYIMFWATYFKKCKPTESPEIKNWND